MCHMGTGRRVTFVAGLRRRAMVAPLVLDGPMNATTFLAYLKECLVPTLKRGDIVMMDSLPVHKVAGVRAVIEASWSQTALSSQILSGPQPDRTKPSANSRRICEKQPNRTIRASFAQDWRHRDRIQPARMHQLLPACGLRFHVTGSPL